MLGDAPGVADETARALFRFALVTAVGFNPHQSLFEGRAPVGDRHLGVGDFGFGGWRFADLRHRRGVDSVAAVVAAEFFGVGVDLLQYRRSWLSLAALAAGDHGDTLDLDLLLAQEALECRLETATFFVRRFGSVVESDFDFARVLSCLLESADLFGVDSELGVLLPAVLVALKLVGVAELNDQRCVDVLDRAADAVGMTLAAIRPFEG